MSTTERLNIPNTINWLNSMELRDIARELGFLSAENEALRAQESALIKALAECRDVFPMPDPGAELESTWGQAMGDPESVPGYVKAQVDALRAQVGVLTAERTVTHRKIAEASEAMSWAMANCDLAGHSYFFERKLEVLRGVLANAPTPSPLTRPAVPEGWKLVPVEPTFLMEDAGFSAGDGHDWPGPVAVYAAMLEAAPQPEAQTTEVGVAIPGWTESDALAILNRISDGPFGQADVDDALEFMRHVDDQRQMKILAAVDEAQPTEAAQPSLMSIINAQADEHAKRSPLDGAAQKGEE